MLLKWKSIFALLIITTVIGVRAVTEVYTDVRIPTGGTIKASSAVNASVSIPSCGNIDYELEDSHKGEQTVRDSSFPKEVSLNISEPSGLTKTEPR